METKLKLRILAKDIIENGYLNSDKCPITRALARAGRPDLKDAGINFKKLDGKPTSVSGGYNRLKNKLHAMYRTKKNDLSDGKSLPIKDFTGTVIIHE